MAKKKEPKERKLGVELIDREDPAGGLSEPYTILFELLKSDERDHSELLESNFYMVWKLNAKADPDNNVLTGSIKICNRHIAPDDPVDL